MPVNADEAVVENRLDAGYGPPGLLVLCVLDQRCLWVSTKRHLSRSQRHTFAASCSISSRFQGFPGRDLNPSGDAFYLDVNDGSELAKVFVELSDVVEIPRDLAYFQFGVHVIITLGKAALVLVVEASPKKRSMNTCHF